MNYIREAENYLKHYRDLRYSLNQIEKEITKIKWSGAPREISAMNLDGMPSGSIQQDEMINIIFKLKCYTEMKENTLKQINEIDTILNTLEKEEGCESYSKLLKLWYVDKKNKEDIAEELGYSSRQSIYTHRNKAIRKFAIRLFGIDVLKAV
jgi:hypothetical protein